MSCKPYSQLRFLLRIVMVTVLTLGVAIPAAAQDVYTPYPFPPSSTVFPPPKPYYPAPYPVNPIDDKTYLNYPATSPVTVLTYKPKNLTPERGALRKVVDWILARDTADDLDNTIKRRLKRFGDQERAKKATIVSVLNDTMFHEDLSRFISASEIPNGDLAIIGRLNAKRRAAGYNGFNPLVNRLILDARYSDTMHSERLLIHGKFTAFFENALRSRESYYSGVTDTPEYFRSLVEIAGVGSTSKGRTVAGPQVVYSNYPARLDVTYQRLFADRSDGDAIGARFDVTPWPHTNVKAQDTLIERFGEYRTQVDVARISSYDASSVEAALIKLGIAIDAAVAAKRTYTEGTLSPRAAFLGNFSHLDDQGSVSSAGISVSQLFPLKKKGRTPGIGVRVAALGIVSDTVGRGTTAGLQTSVGLTWQDRVPFTRGDATAATDAEESWRWRFGFELHPPNAFIQKTTGQFFLRHQNMRAGMDYTLLIGQSAGDQPFVGLRVGKSFALK